MREGMRRVRVRGTHGRSRRGPAGIAGDAGGAGNSSRGAAPSTAANRGGSTLCECASTAHKHIRYHSPAQAQAAHSLARGVNVPVRAPRATPEAPPPPMLFGLRFLVWMPSFFMLSGRLTCENVHL